MVPSVSNSQMRRMGHSKLNLPPVPVKSVEETAEKPSSPEQEPLRPNSVSWCIYFNVRSVVLQEGLYWLPPLGSGAHTAIVQAPYNLLATVMYSNATYRWLARVSGIHEVLCLYDLGLPTRQDIVLFPFVLSRWVEKEIKKTYWRCFQRRHLGNKEVRPND